MKNTLKKQLNCLLSGNQDETKINGILFLNESDEVAVSVINKGALSNQDKKTLAKYGINLKEQ
jgi:hypothetical protein